MSKRREISFVQTVHCSGMAVDIYHNGAKYGGTVRFSRNYDGQKQPERNRFTWNNADDVATFFLGATWKQRSEQERRTREAEKP